jgi:metal-responsive CopG/Arc/MetJ family transcriptional regulator
MFNREAMSKPRGRPARYDVPMVQIAIRFPPDVLEQIDEIVGEKFEGDRASVIRELVAEALQARRVKRK